MFTALTYTGYLLLTLGAFFFITTRGSIILSPLFPNQNPGTRHIYTIYRNPFLIRLVDHGWVTKCILLWQYDRLADTVLESLSDIRHGDRVIQISHAFGSFTKRLIERRRDIGAFALLDIIPEQLTWAREKITRLFGGTGKIEFLERDATETNLPSASFRFVYSFFLFHELPTDKRQNVFNECIRLLEPGGQFVYADFHRPRHSGLRFFSWLYAKIYEPWVHDMWYWDPTALLGGDYTITKELFLDRYFQVVTITRLR